MSMPAASGGKPAMERRRRARINESLSQLKLLIMDDLVDQVLVSYTHSYTHILVTRILQIVQLNCSVT